MASTTSGTVCVRAGGAGIRGLTLIAAAALALSAALLKYVLSFVVNPRRSVSSTSVSR